MLVTLTGPVRPHAPPAPPPADDLSVILVPIAVVVFLLAVLGGPLFLSYWLDRRVHDGAGVFKRRRVGKSGVLAEALVLSSAIKMQSTGSKLVHAYSVVYEIYPPGGAPFRAKGVETMTSSERDANRLKEGERVSVRFDPADHTVVLVRVNARQVLNDREAAQRAREEALLRGGPGR